MMNLLKQIFHLLLFENISILLYVVITFHICFIMFTVLGGNFNCLICIIIILLYLPVASECP